MPKAAKVAKVSDSAAASTSSSDAPALAGLPAADTAGMGGDIPKPYDVYFDALEKCMKDSGALGYVVIRSVKGAEEEEEEEEEEEQNKKKRGSGDKYTAEQLGTMRLMLITESREKFMKKAEKFATCGQAGSGCYMFNTHSGNVIIAGIPKEVSKISKLKTTPERFDGLFALTHLLGQCDYYWFVVMPNCKFPFLPTC
jgi:hypothetical protein